jgi:Cft2 family RNA processing exonuclease
MEQEANIGQRYLGTGPLYGEAEVTYAEERREALQYGRTTRVGELEVTLFDAGHVLGAAGVVIAAGGHRFQPIRDPSRFPVCPKCKELAAMLWGPD